ncbi:holo-ACP synthase [Rhodococcus sp. ABRD24]|uniref:holo-ACP synthase n=1 Tax=Rhodococcus sp. ABRD24 TaxID=2507582 RepID=UPI001F620F1F|nr:holo-ACP synthase [Rhodococcus sp. ABRD24]
MSYMIGIGIDLVEVQGLKKALERTPILGPRLFGPSELDRSVESLAGCFAAKEALAKALGGGDLPWGDVEVIPLASGQPTLHLTGKVAARAHVLGVSKPHLTITHDGGFAAAIVLLEGERRGWR